MANPKYAGLPGIAPPDEKDVYETDDLPEVDQDSEFINEPESENIDRPHLNVVDAHSKFKDKTLVVGKGVDFSDRFRRRRHTGYQAISGDWEIAAEGETETILQRYNRLQFEVKELIEDINKLKTSSAEQKSNELVASEALVPQLEQSLDQLNNCLNLGDPAGNEFIQTLSDPQGTQIKKLLTKLESLKEVSSGNKKSGKPDPKKGSDTVLTYHLQTNPAQNKFLQTARLANLEQRLNKLETVIGTTPENLNRLQLSEFKNLCDAAGEISARVGLLDPGQLDRLEAKLSGVVSKMDSISEKRGGQEFIENEKKINELYDLLTKTEGLNQSIKPITERLIALKSLHVEAGEFKKSLKELETEQANIANNLVNNETALKKVEEALQQHLQTVTKNIQVFDSRLGSIKK